MKLKTSLKPGLLPVTDLARLMERAPDKRTLLSWKLGFHYFISSAEAGRVTAENFSRDANGLPCSLFLPGKGTAAEPGWYIPIKPQDRALISMLLPNSGPLFPADSFKKLILLARSSGIRLSSNSIKESCLTYACASGLYHTEALPLAGISTGILRRSRSRSVTKWQARRFWKLSPDLRRVRRLPWTAPTQARRRH
jgi:hypothetical protein